jgi:hypothetical protein
MAKPVSFLSISGDTVVTDRPCLLNAVHLHTSADGGDVTLYEGQDATSGRQIASLHATANNPHFMDFSHAPFCARGLFVDVGSNVTECTVFFTVLPLNTLEAEGQ